MPDNDGDRGNLVYINTESKKAEILEAQEVFALACVSELSFMVYTGVLSYDSSSRLIEKCAIVVNGPTSGRIEKVCSVYGVKVFRSEVGEANVVSLAKKLIDNGWIIRIIGEGSNGGNITYPATVRDPMNTVGSIVKLLTIKTEKNKEMIKSGLFDIWLEKNRLQKQNREFSLSNIIKTLPSFITTAADDKMAKMKIKTENHGILKNNYERIFIEEWKDKAEELKELGGITDYEEINYMGTEALSGSGEKIRGSYKKGGLKIIFKNSSDNPVGFIWMRGSGTEPLFRVMAEIEGTNKNMEKYLLNWQRNMITRADCP